MDAFFTTYVAAWVTACCVAIGLYLARRDAFRISRRAYWRFLLQPWKVTTFTIAAVTFVVIAPYTGDPTWDYFDAGFMSVLTFLTAPWAVGALYLGVRGRATLREMYVAVCAWMFSASWSYDMYLVLRDGYYPITWWTNILASSVLYGSAGLMWNLEWHDGRGVIFGFMADGWPEVHASPNFSKVMWYAVPFMVLAGGAVAVFLVDRL